MNPMDPQMFEPQQGGSVEDVIAGLAQGGGGELGPDDVGDALPADAGLPPGAPPGVPPGVPGLPPPGAAPDEAMAPAMEGMGPPGAEAAGLPGEVQAPPGLGDQVPPGMEALLGGQGAGPMPPGDEMGPDGRSTTSEVGYDWGVCCGVCVHFIHPESCELVNGHIRPDAVCQLFELTPGLPQDPAYGD